MADTGNSLPAIQTGTHGPTWSHVWHCVFRCRTQATTRSATSWIDFPGTQRTAQIQSSTIHWDTVHTAYQVIRMNLPRSLKDCICRSQASHPHWLVVEIESPERNGNISVKHQYKTHDKCKILLNEFNRSVSDWQAAINMIKKMTSSCEGSKGNCGSTAKGEGISWLAE